MADMSSAYIRGPRTDSSSFLGFRVISVRVKLDMIGKQQGLPHRCSGWEFQAEVVVFDASLGSSIPSQVYFGKLCCSPLKISPTFGQYSCLPTCTSPSPVYRAKSGTELIPLLIGRKIGLVMVSPTQAT